jgi:hypothetical protein
LANSVSYRLGTQNDTGVRFNDDSCYESAYEPGQYSLYELEAVATDEFAPLRVEAAESQSSGYQTLMLRGDDGAFAPLTLAIDGQACQLVVIDGSPRCLASSQVIGSGSQFADAQCTEQVAAAWFANEDCVEPAHALVYTTDPNDSCNTLVKVREVVGRVDVDSPLYLTSGDACSESGQASSPATYYVLGDEAAAQDLPELSRTLIGEGRLQRIEYRFAASDGAGPGYPVGIYDSQLEQDCYVARFADGVLRCMPNSAVYVSSSSPFADPDCTERVTPIHDCLRDPRPTVGYLPVPLECSIAAAPIAEVYEFGAEHTTEIYQQTATGCEAVARQDDYSYFSTSPVDPNAVLATIEEQLR